VAGQLESVDLESFCRIKPMTMKGTNITKVKLKKQGVEIHYDQWNNNTNSYDSKTLKSEEQPHPDFNKAFEELRDEVLLLCEIDDDPGVVEVTGVSFSWTEGDYAAVLSATRELRDKDLPLNLNTPVLWSDVSEGAEGQMLPERTIDKLQRLMVECERYIQGERQQLKLDLEASKEASKGAE